MKEDTIERLYQQLHALESEIFDVEEASASLETELRCGYIDTQSARRHFADLFKQKDKLEQSMESVERQLDKLEGVA